MKLKLVITALLILAVIPSAHCIGEGTPYIPTEDGVYYRVDVITEEIWEYVGFKPEHFWNLTTPDPDILKAMNNPGVFIKTNLTIPTGTPPPGTFLHEWYDHNCSSYFTYNGLYYQSAIYYVCYDEGGSAGGYPWIGDSYHKAVLLDEEPEEYVEIADPNPYLKACFEHPGVSVVFDRYYFRDHPEETEPKELWNLNLSYQGKYYHFIRDRISDAIWLPCAHTRSTEELRRKFVVGGIGVSAAVVAAAFIVYRKRKNQATLGKH